VTSVVRIDLERIERLAEPDCWWVQMHSEELRAFVRAVKAARSLDDLTEARGSFDHDEALDAAACELRDALRPFTEEPGQPNEQLGDALRPSESNGGEQQ
jgi:hypothetical protein